MSLIQYKTYQTVTDNSEGKFKLTWEKLRQEALDKLNNDIVVHAEKILSIAENLSIEDIRPRMDNSSSWYQKRIFTLKVYYYN